MYLDHRHHHFICQVIQQYVHLREYHSRRAGQQGPIRTLTAPHDHTSSSEIEIGTES